jgi:DNA-binding winged helix-turn-helix (wHTH) protein/TolB-like protein/Tfp pilus assembly protein PilF
MQQLRHLYEFGEFLLDESERCLLRKGEPVSLTPKAFDTLLVLVKHGGHVVEKDEMLKEVWPDTFVEEATLAQNIFTLRKALGQGKEGDLYIETVPKRGYRFVADVKALDFTSPDLVVQQHTRSQILIEEEEYEVESPSTNGHSKVETQTQTLAAPHERRRRRRLLLIALLLLIVGTTASFYVWRARRAKQSGADLAIKSIAVLPFKSLEPENDGGNGMLGLGMADAIIIRLSKFQQLPVLPTSAVIKYTGRDNDPLALGQALGVDAVLDGTVQRAGDRIRVTVQLIGVDNGKTLWSDKFDEQFTGIFAVQDSISERVAQALALQLTRDQRNQLAKRYTGNTEAYQAYITGLYFYNKRTKEGLEKAADYFQQAIEKDANYALAYALLADTYYLIVYYRFAEPPYKDLYGKAKAAATHALELDETVAEAHTAMATILSDFEGDMKGAEREHKRAIELNPNYAIAHLRYAWFLSFNGPMEEVVREMRRAQDLDPLSPTTNGALAGALLFTRQYDESIKYCLRGLELEPDGFINLINLGEAYRLKGMYDQAIAAYQRALEINKKVRDPLVGLALTYAMMGRKAEAEKILTNLLEVSKEEKSSFYNIALIYGALNNKDKAFEWLEKAVDARAVPMRSLRADADLDVLRNDPRYADLLKRHALDFLLAMPPN